MLQFAIGETYPSALVFTFLPFEVLPPHSRFPYRHDAVAVLHVG